METKESEQNNYKNIPNPLLTDFKQAYTMPKKCRLLEKLLLW